MKRRVSVVLAAFAMLCMGACGSAKQIDVDTNSVMIDKKGVITQAIVEDFSEPYYSADELQKQIEGQISSYNSKAGLEEAIVLDRFELSEDKMLSVYIKYQASKDYFNFNEKDFFVGTVAEADEKGNNIPDMKTADGSSVSKSEVLEKGENGIVILEEAQQVITPTAIAYISDGVSLIDEKTAVNLNEGEKAYIIYNKK